MIAQNLQHHNPIPIMTLINSCSTLSYDHTIIEASSDDDAIKLYTVEINTMI